MFNFALLKLIKNILKLTAKEKEVGHEIWLISDEPYREIVFGGVDAPYVSHFYPRTLSCYSFSKSLSLPGERLGYVYVPGKVTDAANVYAAVAGAYVLAKEKALVKAVLKR